MLKKKYENLPYKIYEIRQFFNLALSLKNQHRVNMFSNNVGNNCYIRILKEKHMTCLNLKI